MLEKRSRMGRPPAKWVYKLLNLNISENHWMDKHELSQALDVPVDSIKEFMPKLKIARKLERDRGFVRAKYKYGDIKKSVKVYVGPWPIDTIN